MSLYPSFLSQQLHSSTLLSLPIPGPRHAVSKALFHLASQMPHSGTLYVLFLLSGVFFPERFPQLVLSH